MSRLLLSLVLAALLAMPAAGQDAPPPMGEACALIIGGAERLACYDAIFRTSIPPDGAASVRIESEQSIPARPTGREPATMVIACEAGQLSVEFSFARQFLSATSDNAPLSFQVDLGGNTVRNLPVSADNTAAGFPNTTASAAFLDTLEGGTTLRVRVTPVRQRSLTVEFRMRDHADAIAAVREACR